MQRGDFTGLAPVIDPNTGSQFPNNTIPFHRISSQASYFLQFFPLPNTPQGTYVRYGKNVSDFDQFDLRVDHQFRAADSVKFTYLFTQPQISTPGSFPQNGGSTTDQRHQGAGISETHIFGPNVVNQITLGYSRQRSFSSPQGLGTNHAVQSGIGGFDLTSKTFPGFPNLSVGGFTGIYGSFWNPGLFRANNYNFRDLITIARGKHVIQAGAEYIRHAGFSSTPSFSRGAFDFYGTYTGNSWADYLLGLPYDGTRSFATDLFGDYMTHFEPFVRDNWKVTPRLTLNLGLRYSLIGQPTALRNTLAARGRWV
jgi:hypothetical protein